MLAVSSDDTSVETVGTLLQLGADGNSTAEDGHTALDFALAMGRTPVAGLLVRSGVKSKQEQLPLQINPKLAASPRAAVERSLPLLQRADITFLKKSGRVSCHDNSLTAVSIAAARKSGLIIIDEEAARFHRDHVAA
jgi:ankyrin repeat protein